MQDRGLHLGTEALGIVVGGDDAQCGVTERLAQRRKARRQPLRSKRLIAADDELLGNLDILDVHGCAGQMLQHRTDGVLELAALVGQLHRAVGAGKQLYLQTVFEVADLLADRGL